MLLTIQMLPWFIFFKLLQVEDLYILLCAFCNRSFNQDINVYIMNLTVFIQTYYFSHTDTSFFRTPVHVYTKHLVHDHIDNYDIYNQQLFYTYLEVWVVVVRWQVVVEERWVVPHARPALQQLQRWHPDSDPDSSADSAVSKTSRRYNRNLPLTSHDDMMQTT